MEKINNWSTKEWGKNAITGILGGVVISIAINIGWVSSFNSLFYILGSIVSLLGFICALVWLYKIIKSIIK